MFLLKLVFLCIHINMINSQNENQSCIETNRQTGGICRKVSECEIARDEFRLYGINPTFCSTGVVEPIVCCRNERQESQNTSPQQFSATDAPSRAGDGLRLSDKKCQQYSRGVTQNIDYISLLPEPEVMQVSIAKCDYDNTALILGGKDADLAEFPHMVALGWPLVAGGFAIKCGGCLISDRFVVTAGHCTRVGRDPSVSSTEPTIVRLGDHNINPDVYDGASPVEVAIARLLSHPEYRPPLRYNDIALIQLAESVPFSADVRPACLGFGIAAGSEGAAPPRKAVATGWGVVNKRTNRQSEVLQKVTLDILDNALCDQLLKKTRNRNWSGFARSQMCAGVLAGKMDTCQGDSGGPLQVLANENQCIFHVVGVTSFGGACAVANQPAVYTRVSEYLDWIESVVWPSG